MWSNTNSGKIFQKSWFENKACLYAEFSSFILIQQTVTESSHLPQVTNIGHLFSSSELWKNIGIPKRT